jgi:thioredoxin-related protein
MMNKFLAITIALAGLGATIAFKPFSKPQLAEEESITWMSLEDAETASKKSKKPIFMDVYTDWCGPCKMLDRNTFSDPEVITYINKNYHAVKFNAEGPADVTYQGKTYSNPNYSDGKSGRNGTHEFTTFLKVRGYPTMYILDYNGKIVNNIVGYRTADQLLDELNK